MSKVSLALLIHSHQPVGNFDHVIEDAYQKAYSPFVKVLHRHSHIRMSLHFSGILLEWLENHHPEYFDELRELVAGGQVELVGGGFYEPILSIIPDADKHAQIRKLADYLAKHFGKQPRGAWIAERVWEPALPRPLAQAGVEYVVLDDTHFLAAGLEPWQLHGSFMTEEDGFPLRLVPSSKPLRYTIPFQEPEETLRLLREERDHHSALFAMGDDGEKFGVWPGTYKHVYTDRWLERFFLAIEENSDWLETVTVGDYVSAHPPVGRIYLPTASYAEMMEWSLPPVAYAELKRCMDETEQLANGESFRRFLRGGVWRNFLAKYPESNQVQKQMMAVSRRVQRLSNSGGGAAKPGGEMACAREHLLAAQCNDSYWHGFFGGLYSPHLRSALLHNLIKAEFELDKFEGRDANATDIVITDFDLDGRDEILVRQGIAGMILKPADGATASSLRYRPASIELVNSLMRRPEPYHEKVRNQVTSQITPLESGAAPANESLITKDSDLDVLLRYDRYLREAFRTYVFPGSRTREDFEALRLGENEALACGVWQAVALRSPDVAIEFRKAVDVSVDGGGLGAEAVKTLTSRVSAATWNLECRSILNAGRPWPSEVALGLEVVVNLLAPNAHDRYFLAGASRHPLRYRGEINSSRLTIVDEWQGVKIDLQVRPEAVWWVAPIETVSQSELGFERVYQGSAIMAVWKLGTLSSRHADCVLEMEVTPWETAQPNGT